MHAKRMIAIGLMGLAVAAAAPNRAANEAEAYIGLCLGDDPKSGCAFNRQMFLEQYPKALRGDYQSQRNVAYLLSGAVTPPADNPVQTNTLQACAWRLVILKSGHAQAGSGDVGNRNVDCARRGVDMDAAQARADELLRGIKAAKPLPPERPAPRRKGPLDGTAHPLTAD